jgi:hypothetical protein
VIEINTGVLGHEVKARTYRNSRKPNFLNMMLRVCDSFKA